MLLDLIKQLIKKQEHWQINTLPYNVQQQLRSYTPPDSAHAVATSMCIGQLIVKHFPHANSIFSELLQTITQEAFERGEKQAWQNAREVKLCVHKINGTTFCKAIYHSLVSAIQEDPILIGYFSDSTNAINTYAIAVSQLYNSIEYDALYKTLRKQ